MARGTAKWSGEELEVIFSASGQRTDYGVPRSPTWTEWTDFEIDALTILGVDVTPDTLPEDLVSAIYELADDVEFEPEEPDCD